MFYLVAMLSMAGHFTGPISAHVFGPMNRSQWEARLPDVRREMAAPAGYKLDTMCTTRDKVEMVIAVGQCEFTGSFPGGVHLQAYKCHLVARND